MEGTKMKKFFYVLLVVALMLSVAAVSVAAPALNYPTPGTQSTNIYVQNIGASLAYFTIQFTRRTGNTAGSATYTYPYTATPISAKSFIINSSSIASGWEGSAVVSSDQPVAAIVNRFVSASGSQPQLAATYSGVAQPANAVYCANLLKNSASWNTFLTVQNTDAGAATVYLNYYNRNGVKVSTVSESIDGQTQKTYDLVQNASIDFSATGNAGSAYITSTAKLAVTAGAFQWNNAFTGYTCASAGDTTVWVPSVFRRGTGIQNVTGGTYQLYNANIVQNTSPSASTVVTFTFLGKSGYPTCNFVESSVGPLSAVAVNTRQQGTSDPTKYAALINCMTNGNTTSDWAGTLKVTADQPVVAIGIYNPLSITADPGAYEGVNDSGAATVWYCPSVFRKLPGSTADQWSTSLVQNTTNLSATLSAEYYDVDGNLVKAYSNFTTIGGLQSAGLNLKSGVDLPTTVGTDLGTNYVGAVKITASQPVAVMNNIFFSGTNRGSAYTCFPAP